MQTKLNPYLRFNDAKCKEAMTFYQGILGGKLEFLSLGESPMAKEVPVSQHHLIMHAELTDGEGITIYGSDMMRDRATSGDSIGIALNCASQKEIETHFAKLSQGGEVFMPLEEAFWGGVYGVVTDKYGVEWSLNFQKTPPPKTA